MYTLEINIGFLWFSQMRSVLEDYSWRDSNFTWREGRGWLDKTFYIKGPIEEIQELKSRFGEWAGRIEKI